MSDKRVTSVSLDDECADYLSRNDVNGSGLVNKLLKRHMNGGDAAMLDLRIKQVESELESLHDRVENKENELERLKERRSEMEQSRESVLEKAAEALKNHELDPTDRKVEYWADEANLTPKELVEELQQR